MKKLLILLGLLVAAYVLLDIGAKLFVQGRVESEFRNAPQVQADDVSFSVDSFPFLGRLGLFGEVSATLELDGVEEQGVTIDEFELEVDGLVFDRDRAFRGDVLVTGLDQARGAVRFDEQNISELLGVPVEFGDGTATASGVEAQAQMSGTDLVIGAEGVGSVSLPVPMRRYLPCEPTVAFREGVVELSCTTEAVPPIVNRIIGEAT